MKDNGYERSKATSSNIKPSIIMHLLVSTLKIPYFFAIISKLPYSVSSNMNLRYIHIGESTRTPVPSHPIPYTHCHRTYTSVGCRADDQAVNPAKSAKRRLVVGKRSAIGREVNNLPVSSTSFSEDSVLDMVLFLVGCP